MPEGVSVQPPKGEEKSETVLSKPARSPEEEAAHLLKKEEKRKKKAESAEPPPVATDPQAPPSDKATS